MMLHAAPALANQGVYLSCSLFARIKTTRERATDGPVGVLDVGERRGAKSAF
jgi:hypothetical protein